MEKKKHKEIENTSSADSKFIGKSSQEIYNLLLAGVISTEEFANQFYKASKGENPSYTKRIKIKEAVEGIKKGDNKAILEIRKLIMKINSKIK